MLALSVLLLSALALFTAYARNFQRTIVAIDTELGGGVGSAVTPRLQIPARARGAARLAGGPAAPCWSSPGGRQWRWWSAHT